MTAEVQTVLGFDFGLRRIGVAVGQSLTATARPLSVLRARDGIPDWAELEKLLNEWKPAVCVVGLPCNMDGSPHEVTRLAQKFGRRLHGRFGYPIDFVDERLSSIEAESRIQTRESGKKPSVDSVAAVIILEDWFRQQG